MLTKATHDVAFSVFKGLALLQCNDSRNLVLQLATHYTNIT